MALADWLLGGSAHEITWWQMTVRTAIIFAYGLVVIRVAGRRAFGRSSALDMVQSVVIGSSLSRALTGNAPLLATLVAMTALVLLHAFLSRLSFRWHRIETLLKGDADRLVAQGRTDRERMRAHHITERDLMESIRLGGMANSLEGVEEAYLERSGHISVVVKRGDGLAKEARTA